MAAHIQAAVQRRIGYTEGGKYKPVEKGVTGKEKRFQQNRNFGPGAFTPYNDKPIRSREPQPIPNTRTSPRERVQRS